jgi:hypothetical protein
MAVLPDWLADETAIEKAELAQATGKHAHIVHAASTVYAEYYRLPGPKGTLTVRHSNQYPVDPYCLTCHSFDCDHAIDVGEFISHQHAAKGTA